jgi:hypothetical protein
VRSDDQQNALDLAQDGQCVVNLDPIKAKAAWIAVIAASLTACSGVPGIPSGGNAAPAGNASPASQADGATPGPYAGNSNSGDCLLGANGADIEVGIASPASSCAQWIQNLAGDGLVWYPLTQMILPGNAGSADQETMQQACDLTDGTQELYVEDAGGQMYGDDICSQEERNGWTPEGSPGPLASQALQQAQQQAQAQASASAAAAQAQASAAAVAAQAQQVSSAEESLSSDISTLESDSGTLNGDSTLAGDISTMKGDYQTEQSDYQTEQSDGCPGASGDASAVGSDAGSIDTDQSSMQTDIQSLQGSSGIAGIQSDMSAVNSDVSTLRNLGASPSPDPSAALAAGQKAISNANAAIQWANSQASSIDSQARQLATTAQNWASARGC